MTLEDLDDVEQRRRALRDAGREPAAPGTLEDPRLWRKLLSFVRPHVPAMALATGLSLVAAGCKVAAVLLVEKILQPMFESAQTFDLGPAAARLLSLVWPFPQDALGRLGMAARGLAAALGWLVDSAPSVSRLGWATGAFVVLVIIEQLNKYGQKLLMRGVSLTSIRDLRQALYERLVTLSMRFFRANHSGKLLSRLTGDLNKLGVLYVEFMVNVLSDLFTALALLWFVLAKGGGTVVLALGIGALAFLPIQHLSWRIRNREEKNQRQMSRVFRNLTETLSAQKIVQAFGAQKHEIERFRELNDRYHQGRLHSVDLAARAEPLVEVIGTVGVAVFLYLGGRQVLAGTWAGASFFAIILALIQVVAALRRFTGTVTKIGAGLSSADRVATLLYTEPEIVDAPDAVVLPGFHQAIEYEHVWYGHEDDRWVLEDVSFRVPKGRTVALVGSTGSGKSTLGDLLPRFYDVDRGAVRIDGHDVRAVTLASLRHLVALVTQETLLFEGTVASNIAYALPDATREQIERAARAAHAHEFIERLPDGYDTVVGERGMTLSGGERQRLAIARALLRDAPILVLDEATSALDTRSERIVQEAIEALKKGRTTLVIAHRLSTIRDADEILVLERGRIVERGTHAQLLAAGETYARMVRLQG